MKMKRKMAILVILTLVFTTVFGMGTSYAAEEENIINFISVGFGSDTYSAYIPISDETLVQAKTAAGATVTVPYGYITESTNVENDNWFNIYFTLADETSVKDVNVPYFPDEEYGDYYEETVNLKDVNVKNGTFTYVINVKFKNGHSQKFTFHFTEDEGNSFISQWWSLDYYDDNGNEQSYHILESYSDMTNLKKGIIVELPYYYDNETGFKFTFNSFHQIKHNIDTTTTYELKNKCEEFEFEFVSANGVNKLTIPVTVTYDTDGGSAELKSVYAGGGIHYSDDTFVTQEYYADFTSKDPNNEIYIAIPSRVRGEMLSNLGTEIWEDFSELSYIYFIAEAEGSARFKIIHEEDGEAWEELSKNAYPDLELEDFDEDKGTFPDVKLEVVSGNGEVSEVYTVKVIVSDCGENHRYSSWKSASEATCTEPAYKMHKCIDCPYIEYKADGEPLGHSRTATVTKATASKNGKSVLKCTECGDTVIETIYKASSIKLGTTEYTYNGKAKSPKIIVKDSKGKTISSKNYTVVKPSGRKNVGKYTYTIKFKNHYSGTKKLTFKINPKETALKSLSGSKQAITAKWGKVSTQVSGYEVMYATNSSFTKNKGSAKITGSANVSKKITGLKANTKYYVKVRTYKTVDGVKYYSNWSDVKTVKTK